MTSSIRRLLLTLGLLTCAWVLLAAACMQPVPVKRDRRVVVLDFNNTVIEPENNQLDETIADVVTAELINYPRVIVIERQDFKSRFSEGELENVPSHVLGRRANLDYMVAGSVARLDRNYVISAWLLSMATGEIVSGSAVKRSCSREEDIYPAVQALTRELAWHLKQLAERHDRMSLGGQLGEPAGEAGEEGGP